MKIVWNAKTVFVAVVAGVAVIGFLYAFFKVIFR